jgi:hypothetical protein
MNMADLVADQLEALPLDSGSKIANYLAPADIVKKYKEVEIQQQKTKYKLAKPFVPFLILSR